VLNGLDAFLARFFRRIHLTRANDLMVEGFQRKVVCAILRDFALEVSILCAIFFYGFNAVFGSRFGRVHFAAQNDFAIGCVQAEMELAVLAFR
jgi:hypothetical protein